MRGLLLLSFLWAGTAFAQSPFDGTWMIDSNSMTVSEKPAVYLVADGMIHGLGCTGNAKIKADGNDHKIPKESYSDTASARVLDTNTVKIVCKKAGKPMYTETDTVSADGNVLTQFVEDTTEAEAVTTETLSRRVENGPAGAHAVSGSWRAYKMQRSKNGSIIKYKCTADGFSAQTPLGEKFDAKFDGKFYPVEDDPGHTFVSLKLIDANTVEQTGKRDGKNHKRDAFDCFAGRQIHSWSLRK